MADNNFLVEFDSHNGVSLEKIRLSTGLGYMTKLAETPSRAKYLPLVKDAGNINSFLFNEASTTGYSNRSIGLIKLNNADGALDYLEDRGLGGFNIDIREQKGSNYPADFPVRVAGVTKFAEFSSLTIDLVVEDRTALFNSQPYQSFKYAGTNNGTTIELEGTINDIKGSPKPILSGSAKNISPIMVNSAKIIYQVSSEPVNSIDQVYIGRSTGTTLGTVHSTLTAFLAASPSAGTYDVYYGLESAAIGTNERGCFFRLGTSPSHLVTVDATEGTPNLILNNEDAANASWYKSNCTVPGTTKTTSDGKITGKRVVDDAVNLGHYFVQSYTTKPAVSRPYVAAIVVSKDVLDTVMLRCQSAVWPNRSEATFNLTTGTVVGAASVGTYSGAVGSIYPLIDDLYLCVLEFLPDTNTTISQVILLNGGIGYVGNGAQGVYFYGGFLHAAKTLQPLTSCGATAVSSNHIPGLVYKTMKRFGYQLDIYSTWLAQKQFNYPAQHWQGTDEVETLDVVTQIKDSAMFYLTTNNAGKYIIKRLELPTAPESVKTYVGSQILGGKGTPKIKKIASNDEDNGIPVNKVNLGYDQNYTVMTKEQLTGAANTLSELAYVSAEFRVSEASDASVKTKYLNSPERNRNTKLTKVGADAQASYELNIFKVRRPIIEIKIPIDFAIKADGSIIEKGEVITVNSKLYRIIGQKIRLPSNREVSSAAITYQAWGGI